ncbi:hypothetical protein [Nocardioides lijunqiniae]|uniref:hypothetical protein n=1 Tax=Nocardioides lijunqiniae TaxID=2760832 RepID=UPI00187867DD|nr:hypothetical protein [Nocardioides lijunqiniae]
MISLTSIATISTILGGAATTYAGVRRVTQKNERLRERIIRDVELLSTLPPAAASRSGLESHIDDSVRALVTLQDTRAGAKTDPFILIWAAIFLGLGVGAGFLAVQTELPLVVEVGLWGFAGFAGLMSLAATATARKSEKDDDSKD